MKEESVSLRPDDYPVHCQIEVRFRDLDAMGHVNNAVYFTYFEIGRTHYMRAMGHWREEEQSGQSMAERYPFIMLDAYCRYHSAARVAEQLSVHLKIAGIGKKSFRFHYLITAADGRVVASGHSAQVCYD